MATKAEQAPEVTGAVQVKKAIKVNRGKLDERELEPKFQERLFYLRQELYFTNNAVRERNATIKALRSQLRLLNRVMRLKSEAR